MSGDEASDGLKLDQLLAPRTQDVIVRVEPIEERRNQPALVEGNHKQGAFFPGLRVRVQLHNGDEVPARLQWTQTNIFELTFIE